MGDNPMQKAAQVKRPRPVSDIAHGRRGDIEMRSSLEQWDPNTRWTGREA